MVRSLAVVGLLVAAMVSSGCLMPASHAELYVLSFRLENDGSKDLEANPGPHCGSAHLREGGFELEERTWERVGDQPAVVVLPSLGRGWATLGSEGYAKTLPAQVMSRVQNDDLPIGNISSEGGSVMIDGQPVDLPHEWRVEGTDGSWWADARLEKGPDQVRTFRMESCM